MCKNRTTEGNGPEYNHTVALNCFPTEFSGEAKSIEHILQLS